MYRRSSSKLAADLFVTAAVEKKSHQHLVVAAAHQYIYQIKLSLISNINNNQNKISLWTKKKFVYI